MNVDPGTVFGQRKKTPIILPTYEDIEEELAEIKKYWTRRFHQTISPSLSA